MYRKRLKLLIYKARYRLLLYALLIVVFGDLLIPNQNAEYVSYLGPIGLLCIVFAGWNLVHRNKRKNIIYATLLIILTISEIVDTFSPIEELTIIKQVVYVAFFVTFSLELFHQIKSANKVTSSILTAVLCGLIIIGIAGGIGATTIEYLRPGSFVGLNESTKIIDLQYYSFITLTTVGYGDITPITVYAKKFTILITLVGNFYSIVIIGIIIGKYTSSGK
ncbi:potassium channel family protein [Halosquirtibacter laminarini]|uniref:Potassium channel family protein n=1 Tax=Halosquirtibacter laminarini TaxID=3374600 RepID=A0AC61NR55_9BACT|nr:potassium channel family protein [Prolixibacteraceae bacterium]